MLRNLLYLAILILTVLGTTGCGSDPASASGTPQEDSPPPNTARNADPGVPGSAPPAPPGQSQSGQAAPGQVVQGSGGMGAPGAVPQAPAGGPSAAPAQPANWLSYTSPQFSFSISYPDLYIVADQGDLPQSQPQPVHRVRFQDKALAASPTANLQPPQFMIDVFENTDALVLEDWVAANERRATPTEVNVGNVRGYLVALQTMQAPNQFYFVSHGQYIYRLTPLGPYSEDMLRSFKIG